jgi:hypothetical protein
LSETHDLYPFFTIAGGAQRFVEKLPK